MQNTWTAFRLEEAAGDSGSRLVIFEGDFTLADPSILVHGHAIATDATTTFYSNEIPTIMGNTYTYGVVKPLSGEQFFSGPAVLGAAAAMLCGPTALIIDLMQNVDGSLSAVSVRVEANFC